MKPIILVPYRDRETHLKCFTSYMREHFPFLTIAIIEQDNNKPWNKGALFNIGYKWFAENYDYVVLHDVDHLPVVGQVDYSYCELPTIISTNASQFDYRMPYKQFFGGVVVCPKKYYELVNGFSNQFKGWGGEDDMFYKSFVEKGIQPQQKPGRFECFTHPKTLGPDYDHNMQLLFGDTWLNQMTKRITMDDLYTQDQYKSRRDFSEGLSTIDFHVNHSTRNGNIIHIKTDF